MSFGKNYTSFWKNYFNFSGTATRSEFWIPTILHNVFTWFLFIGSFLLFTIYENVYFEYDYLILLASLLALLLCIIFSLAIFLPTISIAVRRLHDIGYSGWFYLLVFVPFGNIILLVFFCLPSVINGNRYRKDAVIAQTTLQSQALQSQVSQSDQPSAKAPANTLVDQNIASPSRLAYELGKIKKLFDENIINSEEYMSLRKKTLDDYLNKK